VLPVTPSFCAACRALRRRTGATPKPAAHGGRPKLCAATGGGIPPRPPNDSSQPRLP
jgi:hypothetical protein